VRLPKDIEELHLIAEYHTACHALRRTGWGGIAFGALAIALGFFFTFTMGPINVLLILIGLLLFVSGIWCLVLPGAEGLIVNGIALILVGLWNIFVTILIIAGGRPTDIWVPAIGVFLIIAGLRAFLNYARFSAALRHGATSEETAMMNDLVRNVLSADSKLDEDIVGFRVKNFWQQAQWRGGLSSHAALFVQRVTKEVLVARKEDVFIEPHGKVLLGNSLKAMVKIGDHKWGALISPQAFDRFREWKFDDSDDFWHDEAADESETGIRPKDGLSSKRSNDIKRQQPREGDE